MNIIIQTCKITRNGKQVTLEELDRIYRKQNSRRSKLLLMVLFIVVIGIVGSNL